MIRCIGNSKPELTSAARTRSRDSRTAVSGRPTIENEGSPRATSTSAYTASASMPISEKVRAIASMERSYVRANRARGAPHVTNRGRIRGDPRHTRAGPAQPRGMTESRQRMGRRAEDLVAQRLASAGWLLVERNAPHPHRRDRPDRPRRLDPGLRRGQGGSRRLPLRADLARPSGRPAQAGEDPPPRPRVAREWRPALRRRRLPLRRRRSHLRGGGVCRGRPHPQRLLNRGLPVDRCALGSQPRPLPPNQPACPRHPRPPPPLRVRCGRCAYGPGGRPQPRTLLHLQRAIVLNLQRRSSSPSASCVYAIDANERRCSGEMPCSRIASRCSGVE